MSVQDDKGAEQDEKAADRDDEQRMTEKPEVGEDQKRAAAEMMESYEEKPTIVLPGAGAMVSGTAVNEWLDEDGNPKYEVPDDADSDLKSNAEEAKNDASRNEQVEKDKALNEELREASSQDNKGEKSSS